MFVFVSNKFCFLLFILLKKEMSIIYYVNIIFLCNEIIYSYPIKNLELCFNIIPG